MKVDFFSLSNCSCLIFAGSWLARDSYYLAVYFCTLVSPKLRVIYIGPGGFKSYE